MFTKETLPTEFTWRGITLGRVIHRERAGSHSLFDMSGGRLIERPSDPPLFQGTVGLWRYSLELQSDSSWVGKIYIGGASNVHAPPYKDPMVALAFAAEWWQAITGMIPYAEAGEPDAPGAA